MSINKTMRGSKTEIPQRINANRKLTLSVRYPATGPKEKYNIRITKLRTDSTVARLSEVVKRLIQSFKTGCAVPLTK